MNYINSAFFQPHPPKVKILSVGQYLPSEVVRSDDLFTDFKSEQKYGIPTNWMSENMGIIERRMCQDNSSPSSLAIPAAQEAIDKADGININHIDLVIFCGIEHDQAEPATAHNIQHKLKLNAKMAFDVSNACFGFIDAMKIAQSLIETQTVRYALIVTGEVPTKLTRYFVDQLRSGIENKKARNLIGFLSVGDAGGAVIMGASNDESGFDAFTTRTDSSHNRKCYYKHGPQGRIEGSMEMAKIVACTLRLQKTIFESTMHEAGWNQPDYLLTHQVGRRAFDQVVDLGITPENRMIKSYDRLGNITSATFALNHYELVNDSKLEKGNKVYGCYSGSGVVVGQFAYTH